MASDEEDLEFDQSGGEVHNPDGDDQYDDRKDTHEVELRLASTNQIIHELGRRFRSVVVGVDNVRGEKKNTSRPAYYWRGGAFAAIGLSMWLADQIKIQNHLPVVREEPGSDEEE